MQKKRASPKAKGSWKSSKASCSRAAWSSGLEKGLVDLLHKHNSESYKDQNGWTTDACNKMIKLFHERFPYVSFSKEQIQNKEKELKRDYTILKEARSKVGFNGIVLYVELLLTLPFGLTLLFPIQKPVNFRLCLFLYLIPWENFTMAI